MKRNQHILFSILLLLEGLVCVEILTRVASELAYLNPDATGAHVGNIVIKIFDRILVTTVIYIELVAMTHICSVL